MLQNPCKTLGFKKNMVYKPYPASGLVINIIKLMIITQFIFRERGGSVVECLTREQGARVRASLASLLCVLEQDTFILA